MKRILITGVWLLLLLGSARPVLAAQTWEKGPTKQEAAAWLQKTTSLRIENQKFSYDCVVDAAKGTAVSRLYADIDGKRGEFYIPYTYNKQKKQWVADVDIRAAAGNWEQAEEWGLYTFEYKGNSLGVCLRDLDYFKDYGDGEAQIIIDAEKFGYGKAINTDHYPLKIVEDPMGIRLPEYMSSDTIALSRGTAEVAILPECVMLILESLDKKHGAMYFLTERGSFDDYSKWYDQYLSEDRKEEYKVGNTVRFGMFEQDNDTADGDEEIQWIVLETDGEKALLLSKYILDVQPVIPSPAESKPKNQITWRDRLTPDITWADSAIRKWLNGTFISSAFGKTDRRKILTVQISTPDSHNQYGSASGGRNTEDSIFLLSMEETRKYLPSDAARRASYTEYAMARDRGEDNENSAWWWLRSPGPVQHNVAGVNRYGQVAYVGQNSDAYGGVRPAMWVELEKKPEQFVNPGGEEQYQEIYGTWSVNTSDWIPASISMMGADQLKPMLIFQPDGTVYYTDLQTAISGTYRVSPDYYNGGKLVMELNGKQCMIELKNRWLTATNMPLVTVNYGGNSKNTPSTLWTFEKQSDDWEFEIVN